MMLVKSLVEPIIPVLLMEPVVVELAGHINKG
jgi:hypothetical protein